MKIDTDLDGSTATNVEIKAGINLTVYVAQDQARAAQQEVGGIIFEVDAKCLADIENEFGKGKEVLLTTGASDEGRQPSKAYICVCFDGLPWIDSPEQIAEFGPEAEAWLNELQDETGFELHQ